MSEYYISTNFAKDARVAGAKPVVIVAKDRIAAMQVFETHATSFYGANGVGVGKTRGNAAIRAFIEGKADHVVWGRLRLDTFTLESK